MNKLLIKNATLVNGRITHQNGVVSEPAFGQRLMFSC